MKNTLLIYIILVFFASCSLPVDDEYVIIQEISIDEEAIVDIIIEETPVDIVDEDDDTDEIIIIQEVHSMELQPIKEFEGYVRTESKVFGINGDGLEEIKAVDTENNEQKIKKFFVVDGLIYLSVEVTEIQIIPNSDPEESESVLVEYFFMQSKGEITKGDNMLTMPLSARVQFSDTKFQINNVKYGDLDISNVTQMPAVEAYLIIDGCKRVDNGLWFSVPESYKSRNKGVYFWGIGSGKTVRVKDAGRIW